MGVVYEARDTELGHSIALKMLHTASTPSGCTCSNASFVLWPSSRTPNLVRLGELHFDEDQWFFTMELLASRHLLRFVRHGTAVTKTVRANSSSDTLVTFDSVARVDADTLTATTRVQVPDGPRSARPLGDVGPPIPAQRLLAPEVFDEERLRASLKQLASGVHALHRYATIHLDIKPSNVLVNDDGRVVVVDFGLVQHYDPDPDAAASQTDQHRQLVSGTVPYMAPEQGMGEAVAPAADWYAVGILLYEALTGNRPFEGPAMNVIMAKVYGDLVPPSALVAGLPEDLETLCLALLRSEPNDRPTGHEIVELLGADADEAFDDRKKAPVFVGREAEIAQLTAARHRSQGGDTCVAVLVEGEPGVGQERACGRVRSRFTPRAS